MDVRIMGIDISDSYTSMLYYGEDRSWHFPTVICKNKHDNTWTVGESAYAAVLSGKGVITDKLLSITQRHGIATISGFKFEGYQILKQFIKTIIDISMKDRICGYPEEIVVSIPSINYDIVKQITRCFIDLGYPKNSVHVISRSESFIHYVMSQSKDVWNNQVGLFNLQDNILSYYELRVQRNSKNMIVYAETENMEEGFDTEILSSAAGGKLADKILTSCAERLINKKMFSSIILTGKGFENRAWATEFLKYICSRRKVFIDSDLFSKGACVKGLDYRSKIRTCNFTSICDGRLDTTVTITVEKHEKELAFPIASAGDKWYESMRTIRLIVDNISEIELNILPMDIKKRKTIRIPIDFIAIRHGKTTRIDIKTSFIDGRTMKVEIIDVGFGELFPASKSKLVQEVLLWG